MEDTAYPYLNIISWNYQNGLRDELRPTHETTIKMYGWGVPTLVKHVLI